MNERRGGGGGGGLIVAILVVLAVILAAGLLVSKLAEYNDAETSRLFARGALEESYGRAQGEIIRAQSQARLDSAMADAQMMLAQGQTRLDSAQAFAITSGAALPWVVVSLVGVSGAVLIVAIVAILVLAVQAMQAGRQDRLLLAIATQRQMLPMQHEYFMLPAPEREKVIEL